MKAERRHELKQNTLARGLETLPEVSRRHGNKVMFGVLIVLAAVLLIRWRITASRGEAELAAYSLNNGRDLIQRLDDAAARVPPGQLVKFAGDVAKGVEQSVTQVLESSSDPRVVAEARLLQGDLNWKLANLPTIPGATTRPELALPKSDEQLLNAAADAYQAVLAGSPPVDSAVSARLGLAAVNENRRQWDKAKEQYQKVVDDLTAPKPLKDLAAQALTRLETLRKAPLVAPPSTQPVDILGRPIPATTSTSPTTGAATGAATGPATGPSSAPATGPASAPAAVPSTKDAKPQAVEPAPQPAQPAPQPAPQNPTEPG